MSARVAPGAIIEGTVVLADGARVLENAVIRGPAYIGEKAIIGNNVLIRGGCHIGAGSVVGFSTEVKHSYIGKNCWFHSNYVGDSVIDDRCSFGSGAVTANLRFDEGIVQVQVNGDKVATGMDKLGVIMGAGSQVGINASLMPGVLVGPGAVVGPHVCLTGNLAPGHRALSRAEYRVEDLGDMAPGSAREAMRRKLDSSAP
jgi:bifunctional UDP-N-acetylglucosamine pyrophosphorylase/glucosamine-1-phosphate N-acetyltransferase